MENVVSKISIVMPVYNAQRFLSQTIDSVLSQSYSDFELIMIDDCSTDNSLEILTDLLYNCNMNKRKLVLI